MADTRKDVFDALATMAAVYRPPLVLRGDLRSRFELVSEKEVVVAGRKRKEMSFASVIPQRGYVGLYFMPIYTHPELVRSLPEELKSTLKGKSCFHIKTLDRTLTAQIRKVLETGFRLYKKEGWI